MIKSTRRTVLLHVVFALFSNSPKSPRFFIIIILYEAYSTVQ
jgi:hypothetical protein